MCFLRKLFRGRVGRLTFFLCVLYLILFPLIQIFYLIYYIQNLSSFRTDPSFLVTVFLFLYLVLPFFLLPIARRRLHDVGWSQRFSALVVIPVVNIFVALALSVTRSKESMKRYKRHLRFYLCHFLFIILFVFILFVGFDIIRKELCGYGCPEGRICAHVIYCIQDVQIPVDTSTRFCIIIRENVMY